MTASAPDLAVMDPPAVWAWLAGQLAAAVGSARHGLHLLTVATVDDTGSPGARTVVLRGIDADRREVRFHTDARSPKIAALRRHPALALHWYDPALRIQLQMPAVATFHHGDQVASEAWRAALAMSRACYTTAHAPGTPLTAFPTAPLAPAEGDDAGLTHFAVVVCRFATVELVSLHARGHQRVRLHVDRTPVTWDVLAP